MSYGMPYLGSKSRIAKDIIKILPSAEYFVDLFGGGVSMSLCALQSKKYTKIIYNEKESLIYKAFNMAINGQFKDENRWISREDFEKLKTTDPYVVICYSFGNNLQGYCYSSILEPWKEALHYARVFGDCSKFEKFGIHSNGSKFNIINNFKEYKQKYIMYNNKSISCDAQHFSELESLERLERLNNIFTINDKHFGELQNIQSLNLSYELVNIPKNSVIYCDPPYVNTQMYLSKFDYAKFYNWCRKQNSLVFISEYIMPEDFYLVDEFKRKEIFNNNSKDVYEKLYCNKPFKPLGQRIKLF